MHDILFTPTQLGSLELPNRIVMAPMTRDRAGPGDIPTSLMVEYYRQRASAGLIITEGVQPSAAGKGYWRTPGIWSQEQVDGWAKVAEAVHSEGGRIVMQLMHCGRVVVPANRGYEADVIAPSAITCPDLVPGPDGIPTDCALPRALHEDELPVIAGEYGLAARNALAAGIDGVELHCASGYLINQFLNPASNRRTDTYGGSPEHNAAFPLMVLATVKTAMGGGDRLGIRISPGNPYNAMDPTNPEAVFTPFLKGASALELAYLHIVDMDLAELDTLAFARCHWQGAIIANNNLKADTAAALIEGGRADAVSFGRAFIANPDLPARIRNGEQLAKPDYAHLYTGEEIGYIDYLSL